VRISWRKEIIYIVALSMGSCWLAGLLLFLNELLAVGHRLSIVWLWLVYPAAFLLNRLLQNLGWRKHYRYFLNGLVLILSIVLLVKIELYAEYDLLSASWLSAWNVSMSQMFQAFQPELLVIIGCGVLFWQGWHLAQRGATFATQGTGFQFGLGVLLIVLFSSHLAGIPVPNAVFLVLLFPLLALIGLGFCQSGGEFAEQPEIGGRESQLLLVTVGVVLLLGLVVGSLITSDQLHLLVDAFRWAMGVVGVFISFLAGLFPEPDFSGMPPPGAISPKKMPQEDWNP